MEVFGGFKLLEVLIFLYQGYDIWENKGKIIIMRTHFKVTLFQDGKFLEVLYPGFSRSRQK